MLNFGARLGICSAIGLAAAAAQPVSRLPADPAAAVEDLEQRSGQMAKTWLQSADARTRAWGAYLALRDQLTGLSPELLAILSAYAVDGTPASAIEKDEHDALIPVLDALIQFGGDVAVADAARIYGQFPAQSLILLSRSSQDVTDVLLDIFEREAPNPGWLAAGNLLAARQGRGFAAAVLQTMTVHAVVYVQSPGGPGYGRGGSSCCGGGIPVQPKAGWPPAGSYTLAQCGTVGAVLLAGGTDPAYYVRSVNAFYPSTTATCMCHPDPDVARQHYLNTLLSIPAENPLIRAEVSHSIQWQAPEAYQSELMGFVREQQNIFAAAARKLAAAGLLAGEEIQSARPKLAIEIWDQRVSQETPLPVLAGVGGNVSFTHTAGGQSGT